MSERAVLTLLPTGHRMPVADGQTLLAAALAAGVALRSSCRNGTCRACLAQVRQGSVRHTIPWPGLSADERADGWVLPCVAVTDGDVVLAETQVDPPPPAAIG
jgi:ferredoxin